MSFRLNLFGNSFFPCTITEYNNIDSDIRENNNAEQFHRQILPAVDKPKSWYYVGDRKLSIVHARLRVKCSQLSGDLFSLNIIESPKCQCGHGFENSKHYFHECPLYTIHRNKLYDRLNDLNFDPSETNILYGNSELNEMVNIKAVFIIHDFIKDGGRF